MPIETSNIRPRKRSDVTDTRVDLHVKVLDERVVRRAKNLDLDVLVYAPHFTRWPDICERAVAFSDEELLVVPGRELFTGDWRTRRHVLALGLEASIPDFLTLEGTMAELREDIGRYRDQIDAIEVYNPKHLPRDNRRARQFAADLGLPEFASSYAHLRQTVGEAWTTFETSIDSAADLHAALRAGDSREVGRRDGVDHFVRCGLEFAHLGWENSWQKIDRLYLSGTEPTHPTHVAYDGRFDDVRVY